MGVMILAKTEHGFKEFDGDWTQWKNLGRAYGVKDQDMHLVPDLDEILSQFDDIKKVFLEPPYNQRMIDQKFIDLEDYKHPDDCVYIFGNATRDNIRFITEEDDIVYIRMLNMSSRLVFGVCMASILLYDRMKKHG